MKKAKAKPPVMFPQEQAVLSILKKRKSGAGIDSLYAAARPGRGRRPGAAAARRRHQCVGTIVFRLNRKLGSRFIIKPGAKPRTYRLVRR